MKPDTPTIVLRKLPGIDKIERLMRGESEWLSAAELQDRIDEVSISLFGITEADTRRTPKDAINAMGSDRSFDALKHGAIIDASRRECAAWDEQFRLAAAVVAAPEMALSCGGVDIRAVRGKPLLCLGRFIRQLHAATAGLVPAAKLTPDGSGRRASDVDAWAAAMERDAKAFAPQRRRTA